MSKYLGGVGGDFVKNSILRNFGSVVDYKGSGGSIFQDNSTSSNHAVYLAPWNDDGSGYLASMSGKLYGCLFKNTAAEIGNIQNEDINDVGVITRLAYEIIESFDHNQIVGN
jgi:hypothetical protein